MGVDNKASTVRFGVELFLRNMDACTSIAVGAGSAVSKNGDEIAWMRGVDENAWERNV